MIIKFAKITFGLTIALLFVSATAASWDFSVDVSSESHPDTVLNTESRYIAVFGDIQNYFNTNTNMQYYRGSLEWISRHSSNIAFMMHTGDVTNNNYVSQWENFQTITTPFTETLPFYTCIGNHDYWCNASNHWNHRDSTRFSDYVDFPSTVSHIVAYYESSNYENILVREELFENDQIYLLILELEPRRAVVQWADSLVKCYPDENIILITHRYLSAAGKRYLSRLYMTDTESQGAKYLWENLIYDNDNIRCVLCGHVGALSRMLYSMNAAGRIVPQIEFNIQKQPHGGNGLIELWEFDSQGDVYVRTFNTHTEQYVNDSLTEFQFRFK